MTAPHPGHRAITLGAVHEEHGGALPAVLVLIVVLSALVGAVLAVHVAERRLVRRDLARAQARYAAEAGVQRVLFHLALDPAFRADGEPLEVPGVQLPVRAWVRSFGTYAEVRAIAATRPGRASHPGGTAEPAREAEWVGVRALAGAEPGPGYAYALVLGDSLSTLTLAGDADITGDVLTGQLGARPGQLQGRGYRGELRGRVLRAADRPAGEAGLPLLPPAVLAFAEETFERYGGAGRRGREGGGFSEGTGLCPADVAERFGVDFVQGERVFRPGLLLACTSDGSRLDAETVDALLSSGKAHGASSTSPAAPPPPSAPPLPDPPPLLLMAEGALDLDGSEAPLSLPPGSVVFARGPLRLRGDIEASGVLLVGESVDAAGPVRLQGQILARRGARLDGGARVRGAVTVLAGRRRPGAAALDLGDTRVDGTVLYVPDADQARAPGAGFVFGERAEVRGVLYSSGTAELSGRVRGSTLVRALYFYASPAAYTNWLGTGRFDRGAMPAPLVLPLALGGAGDGRPARPVAFDLVEEGLVRPIGGGPSDRGGPYDARVHATRGAAE